MTLQKTTKKPGNVRVDSAARYANIASDLHIILTIDVADSDYLHQAQGKRVPIRVQVFNRMKDIDSSLKHIREERCKFFQVKI